MRAKRAATGPTAGQDGSVLYFPPVPHLAWSEVHVMCAAKVPFCSCACSALCSAGYPLRCPGHLRTPLHFTPSDLQGMYQHHVSMYCYYVCMYCQHVSITALHQAAQAVSKLSPAASVSAAYQRTLHAPLSLPPLRSEGLAIASSCALHYACLVIHTAHHSARLPRARVRH